MEGAIADCTRAIKLDPRYAPAYSTAASRKKDKGDLMRPSLTTPAPSNSIRNTPMPITTAASPRGPKATLTGPLRTTSRDRTRSENAGAYNERGIAKQTQGDLNEAIADYTRRRRIRSEVPQNAYYNRGVAKWGKATSTGP